MLPLTGAGPSTGADGLSAYATKVLTYSPIAYWQLNEATGTDAFDISGNGLDGTYTNCTLGQTGIGDGNTAPLFDNEDCYVNIYSTGFRDAFKGAAGTAMIWAKVFNVGVWTDAHYRYFLDLQVDGENLIFIRKSEDNTVNWRYEANNVSENGAKGSLSPTAWVNYAITWDKAAEEVILFYGGVQEGAAMEALGVWVGNLSNTDTIIGAQSTTQGEFHGWLAHTAVWDSALTPTQVADLAVV